MPSRNWLSFNSGLTFKICVLSDRQVFKETKRNEIRLNFTIGFKFNSEIRRIYKNTKTMEHMYASIRIHNESLN